MSYEVTIRQVENGYILKGNGTELVFLELQELLDHLLRKFEGRSDTFTGELWGRVVIERGETPKS